MCESFARLLFSSTQAAAFEPEPFVVNDNCTVGDVHALLDSLPTVCGRMAKESPDPQPQARGAGSATEPANSHWDIWARSNDRPRRRWRDMTDESETEDEAVGQSVAAGPTAAAGAGVGEGAANPAHVAAGPEAAAAGAGLCEATPRTARICEIAPGIFVNAARERCDKCLISVKFSVAQVSIVSFNQTCMP